MTLPNQHDLSPSKAPRFCKRFPRVRSGKQTSTLVFVVIAGFALSACPAEKPGPEIETVEIGPKATANLTPEGDVTESVGAGSFAGQLPANFPQDLPVPASSSVISKQAGRVSFGTDDTAANTKVQLEPELARAGWHNAGGTTYRKGERSVRISFSESAGQTTVTYRY